MAKPAGISGLGLGETLDERDGLEEGL